MCFRWWARFLALFVLIQAHGAEPWKTLRLRNETIQTPPKTAVGAAPSRVEAPAADGLWLVQFESRIQPAWAETLAAAGVDLLYYVPDDAFVARLRGARLASVRALDFVRWMAPLQPRHKVHLGVMRALAGNASNAVAVAGFAEGYRFVLDPAYVASLCPSSGVCSLTVGVQALINICGVTGLAPTKGIALPLRSRGGTGWILTCLSIGLLISMDRGADRRRRELGLPVPGEEQDPFLQPVAHGTSAGAA
jgi:hypothetical protein